MKVHIGKRIKEKVKQSGMSVTEFAKRINYSRRNIYAIFDKETIDMGLMFKIGEVLDHNFLKDYVEQDEELQLHEPSQRMKYIVDSNKELQERVEFLERENMLLKEINQLLKDKMGKG